MEMKQSQTLYRGTYSHLTPYLFYHDKKTVTMTFKTKISQFYDYGYS